MATASHTSILSRAEVKPLADKDRGHRLRLRFTWLAAISFLLAIAIYGFPYYQLDMMERAHSPYHAMLRPSGAVGLRLGMLAVVLFLGLFLYPIRKHWPWLARIGSTKNWLDFHILLGITAPVVVTFHSSFKFAGLAGVAYWIMVAVALSGFIGRYLYAQIPRSLNTAELSFNDMESAANELTLQVQGQAILTAEDIAPLLKLPSREQVARMSIMSALWTILRLDLSRPFLVSRLRRKSLTPFEILRTVGGLLRSKNYELEGAIAACRSRSWISAKMLFLTRIQELFHLWHVVHRPFSYSFAGLIVVHIGVVALMGYF
jgi:hypothetical protein